MTYRGSPGRETDRAARTAATPTATNSEDAPAITAIGGRRKRASITYAATASIAYLVKNFTSARTRPGTSDDAAQTPFFKPR